jgi:hypothetical protein
MAAGGAVAARGTAGDSEATHGAIGVGVATRGTAGVVEAARCTNPRAATSGSKPGGTTGAGWLAGRCGGRTYRESRVLMVETTEPDSKRKSRSVRLDEVASGNLSSSKTTYREMIKRFVERSRQ